MHESFKQMTEWIALGLEGVAALLIAYGGVAAIYQLIKISLHKKATQADTDARREAWRNFAAWLLLGLEFTLGADIVRTAIAPTWDSIGQLAAVALIRTFLGFFLERDIEITAGRESK